MTAVTSLASTSRQGRNSILRANGGGPTPEQLAELQSEDDSLSQSHKARAKGRQSMLRGSSFSPQVISDITRDEDMSVSSLLKMVRPTQKLDTVLRCFVPAIIEERVEAGQVGAWVSEHRKLVSVFMKVLGLGPKPCEVADKNTAHEVVRVVQERTQRFDGTITRLICDDKGTRFLIAYGLPGHANESPNDESRAVVSCLQVVEALEHVSPPAFDDDQEPAALGVAVGITTGRVFCGEAGSELRREYTLAGARVNLAARLMQHAGKTPEKVRSDLVARSHAAAPRHVSLVHATHSRLIPCPMHADRVLASAGGTR